MELTCCQFLYLIGVLACVLLARIHPRWALDKTLVRGATHCHSTMTLEVHMRPCSPNTSLPWAQHFCSRYSHDSSTEGATGNLLWRDFFPTQG